MRTTLPLTPAALRSDTSAPVSGTSAESILSAPLFQPTLPASADVVIAGAGIIGLSLAVELHARGARVIVVERGRALQQASCAAAGMLAVHDPANPAELGPLAQLSISLYPSFLRTLHTLSGVSVPFQTSGTWQYGAEGSPQLLAERSLDPRQLAHALLAAARGAGISLIEQDSLCGIVDEGSGLALTLTSGGTTLTRDLVLTAGAWSGQPAALGGLGLPIPVVPRKGQMLRVQLSSPLTEVHRSEAVYVVPRTIGADAGSALIGATIEDAGFDISVHSGDLARLQALAAGLLPRYGLDTAPILESWAGLRPAAPDMLPVLGCFEAHRFIAAGHYRNGILLAPATAQVLANLLAGEKAGIDLSAFSPLRFSGQAHSQTQPPPPIFAHTGDKRFFRLR